MSLAACSGSDDPGAEPDVDGLELVSADVPRAAGDPAAVPGVVAAMHATGGALLGLVAQGVDGNLALSPYSITTALALTANGAVRETRRQLELVFGGTEVATVNDGLNALSRGIESLAGKVKRGDESAAEVEIDAANALFGQRGVAWEEPFLETLAASYGAGIYGVDWARATEEARAAVNAWTAHRTRDKIPEIVPAGAVDAGTRLVLVNALYLKAPWETPFNADLTEDGSFTLLDGSVVEVPMMVGGGDIVGNGYAAGDGWRAARLPYAGNGLAMTVVLPDAGRFEKVEAEICSDGFGPVLDELEAGGVDVTMPRWTFRTQVPLKETLRSFGVEAPFTAADFSAMTTDVSLEISEVLHEVFIAFDEEGTEAAAATAVLIQVTGAVSARQVVVDRPFLFVVHDVEHGTPLFVGRVLDPSA